MITSYFTDPLEKTDSSNWADRKHTQDEVEETFMMETFSCAFSDSVLHRKAVNSIWLKHLMKQNQSFPKLSSDLGLDPVSWVEARSLSMGGHQSFSLQWSLGH